MSVNLKEIKPGTLKIIQGRARLFGLSVDEYIRAVLPKTERELSLTSGDEFEADMKIFAEDAEDVSEYKGTYSREDIYLDHD